MTYFCPPEPAEISWGPDGITFIPGTAWEWWIEKIAYRAKVVGS